MSATQKLGTGRSCEFCDDGASPNPAYVFSFPEDLSTLAADNAVVGWIPGSGESVSGATGVIKTPPTGADATFDIKVITNLTGTVARTLGTLTIAAGAFTGTLAFAADVIAITESVEVSCTQKGLTIAGANATVKVH